MATLQIIGKNQLVKEMNECAGLASYEAGVSQQNQKKIFHDEEALHRNEVTGEIEPVEEISEYLDSVNQGSPRNQVFSGSVEREKDSKDFRRSFDDKTIDNSILNTQRSYMNDPFEAQSNFSRF